MTNFKRKHPVKKWFRGGCSCGWDKILNELKNNTERKLIRWEEMLEADNNYQDSYETAGAPEN